MFNINLNDRALKAQLTRIATAGQSQALMAYVGKRVGVAAESVIPPYPPPSHKARAKIYQRRRKDGSTYLSAFKSAKMQGKVFVLISEGKIPTRRSGRLGRSIVSAIESLTSTSVTIDIGTNVDYAPLVIGDDDQQAAYHNGTWWQLQAVIAGSMTTIEGEAQKALTTGVQRLINGESL